MKQQSITAGLACLLLAITMAVYWPGLNGPFLFDDFANLNALGEYHGIRDWETFSLYLFGNHSGPTGRPVSMLSFLLNDNGWPSDPWSFKYTNLMLHLGNGLILFTLARRLLSAVDSFNDSAATMALLMAGFWLLHPLNVSTVLYPVQRMTILAAFFVLAGLLGYTHGRFLLSKRPRAGYLWMSLSISLGTILATYSKENGALLPVLALCLEVTVFSSLSYKLARYWKTLFLWLPLILLISYFIHHLITGSLEAGYTRRPFTLAERLLTESRILFDYLYYWFIPHINSPGLLTQDFPLSKSLFNPLTTFLSILGIVGLIGSAIVWRSKYPVVSLAILFYFTGHIIESTIIPLELYFEHRNYLPGIFLILPVISGVMFLIQKHKGWSVVAVLILATPTVLTAQRAHIWSNEETLFYHWADYHLHSQRAQRYAALVAEKYRKPVLAYHILSNAKERLPESIAIRLHWLTLACRIREIPEGEQLALLGKLQNGFYSFRNRDLLRSSIEHIHSGSCLNIEPSYSYRMIKALEKNPVALKRSGARHQLHHIRGLLHLKEGDYQAAYVDFRNAQKTQKQLESGIYQTALLATYKQYDLALDHLRFLERSIDIEKAKKAGTLDYMTEIDGLRKQIILDKSSSKTTKILPPAGAGI